MIISNNGQKIEQIDYKDEDELQALLFEHPELLANEGSDLYSIMREVQTEAGRIDVLAMSASGEVTIVEVKLGRNAQSRREVLAQIIDYISALSDYSYYRLDEATKGNLGRAIADFENAEELPRKIEDNLRNGLVRLIIAVDEINDDLRRLVEFMTNHTNLRVDLIEVKKYKNGQDYFYGSTPIVQASIMTKDERANSSPKEYPLLDQAVKDWEKSGELPKVINTTQSYRQIRVDDWPKAIHYEYTTLYNKPILYIRLDNELYAKDPRSDVISAAIDKFVGQVVCGYELKSRPYSRSGSGRILYIALPAEEINKSQAIMKELIALTKDSIQQALEKDNSLNSESSQPIRA